MTPLCDAGYFLAAAFDAALKACCTLSNFCPQQVPLTVCPHTVPLTVQLSEEFMVYVAFTWQLPEGFGP
jgi:hypothetical protein